jgi:hypothetical protein
VSTDPTTTATLGLEHTYSAREATAFESRRFQPHHLSVDWNHVSEYR